MIELDPVRSERFGEDVPTAAGRQRLHDEGIEHIDVHGQLRVPLASSMDVTPKREGWEPYWVNIVLTRRPQKWVVYRRPKP